MPDSSITSAAEAAEATGAAGGAALPVFGFVTLHGSPLADGIADESTWLEGAAASGRAAAHLWQAPPSLVVPRSYERLAGWAEACAASAAEGWPVYVRSSGGGLVPQGPGVLNLSLAWRAVQAQPIDTDGVYRALCSGLQAALARVGVEAAPQQVLGSFCDGRYNLAAGGAKLVGTAQSWRRVAGHPAVLAHAVLLVDADPEALTARCNRFEALAGSGRRYDPRVVTSVARACAGTPPADLAARLRQAIAEVFARVLAPRAAASR